MRTKDFSDSKNPMREVDASLSTCAWALRSTASVVTGRLPRQLIYNQDMTMGDEADMDWSNVLKAKENQIMKNNELENKH